MSFLLANLDLADLCVSNNTNGCAVLRHSLEFRSDVLFSFSILLSVSCECFFLATVPVFVRSTLAFLAQVLRPYSGERAQSTGSVNVSNDPNNNNWRGLDDSDGLDNFLLVHVRPG